MEWNSDAARRLWEVAQTAAGGVLGDELRKLAVEVEGEVESAWADGTDAYFDMIAAENGWVERHEGEEVEEYVKRCFLPMPRYTDGRAWEPVRTCRMVHESAERGLVNIWSCSECHGINVTLFEQHARFCQCCGAEVRDA